MHITKKQNTLSLLEAVDNLSSLVELHFPLEKEKMEPQEFRLNRSWHDPEGFSFNIEKARGTFTLLFNYLRGLYENEEDLSDPSMQKGLQAMMLLVMEAATHLEHFLSQFPEGRAMEKVTEWGEYTQLQQFYLNSIAPKLKNKLELVEKWQEEWGVGVEDEEDLLSKRRGIEDIIGVRSDRDYELFFIRKEDGSAYFNRALLRHMHLIEQFDILLTNPPEEDALFKLKSILDKDLQLCAKEIIAHAAASIDEFYRMGMKHKEIKVVAAMHKTLMALMLAAHPRNSLQMALGKCCTNYFADFHLFLRTLLSTVEYKKMVAHPPPASERLAHCLLNLTHVLCSSFFMRSAAKEEMLLLIRQLIEQGEEGQEVESETRSPSAVWNNLLDEDAQIRSSLKFSPFGPLHNAIAVFAKNEQLKGFDPIFQGNFPYALYTVSSDEFSFTCMHLPCPTFQSHTKKAEIVPEFLVYLRALAKKKQTHLLFNLQDSTSWQEHARTRALEEAQYDSLKVVTLATGTDFYLQSGEYRELDDAKEFMRQFKEQIEGGAHCGFCFPEDIELSKAFLSDAMHIVHDVFFGGKKTLAHKNRLDFVQIFYMFLALKCIERIKPQAISFTSKDSIDAGSAFSAQFFAFLKTMNFKKPWTEEEKDFLRWLTFAPALASRQRSIDDQQLKRASSALCTIGAELDAHRADVVAAAGKLFALPFFKHLQLSVLGICL